MMSLWPAPGAGVLARAPDRGAAVPARVLAAALAVAGAAAAGPASAHVTLETAQVPADATTKGVFRLPHGCEGGAATIRLTVHLPDGVRDARPMPKAGWTLRLMPRETADPATGHGAAPQLAAVVWEGGRLDHAHYDEFVIRFRTPNRPGETIWFPVVQDCEGGGRTAWDQVPEPGRRVSDYPHPAASLRLAPRP